MIRWESESELALRAVSTAGELAVDRPEGMQARSKESYRDVVTELDVRIERHIRATLEPSGHPVVGEEMAADRVAPGQTHWLVDPIDGTANFVAGMPFYAVSVGLSTSEGFCVGAVALPALKELFFTHGDRGAYLNGRPCRVEEAPIERALIVASFSGAKGDPALRDAQYALFGRLNDRGRGALRLGSAATNLCYVACGRLQVAYGVAARSWDVAAGIAIAARAGARVYLRQDAAAQSLDYVVGAPGAAETVLEEAQRAGFLVEARRA